MRFVQITDHHLGTHACAVNRGYATAWGLARVLDAIAAADGHGSAFLLCTGDLVTDGEDAEYAFARGALGIAPGGEPPGPLRSTRPGLEGLPMYVVPGNHDPRGAFARNLFAIDHEVEHLDASWTVDGVAFAYLDLGTGSRSGVLREASLALLDRVLVQGAPTVVVLHHHPVEVGIPWLDRALPAGIERLWARVRQGRVLGVLFGHTHATVARTVAGVPVLGLRSTCFQFGATEEPTFVIQPLQYRVVDVDGQRLTSRVYEVPLAGPAEGKAIP